MSMCLRIFGIRKLKRLEISLLAGKTASEIHESQLFRKIYPSAHYNSGYRFYCDSQGSMKSIKNMIVPVVTADDDPEFDEHSYIYWEEELGYYWRDLAHDDPMIDEILETLSGYIHYDQAYSVVPYELVGQYMNKSQPSSEDEIIAVSYG